MSTTRVLLIEDNDVDAAIFTRCIEAMPGWNVVRVGSLEEAEERVEELGTSHFDLVAVDLTLPDAVDLEAVHFARTQIPQAVCVAVTARNPDEVDERALRAGAADLLVKGQMNARGVQRAATHAVERNMLVRRQLESERNLRSVLGAWNDALFVVDRTRKVVFRNDAAAAFDAALTVDADGERHLAVDVDPGDVLQTEVQRADGEGVPVELRAWRLTWADGPAKVVVVRDRRAERAAQRARQLAEIGRGALEGVHDIGNRIQAMRGYLLDARRAGDPGGVRHALDALEEACDHIAAVVRSSREGASQVRQRRIPVDVAALARSSVQGMRTEIDDVASVRLQLGASAEVMGEPADLTRVLDNLIANAVDAMAEHPREAHELRVAVTTSGDRVVVEVEDTGPGIPAERLERIFQQGVTFKAHGTGLGLASARSLVRGHDGDITVQSTVGQGTVFRIDLPAVHPDEAVDLKILLVEDQPDVARANKRLLGEQHRVEVARDGHEALAALEADDTFDVILCDLDMPGLDGLGFYAALGEKHPQLVDKVVFCSGGTTDEVAAEALAATGRPALHKPFDARQALAVIAEVAAT